MKTIKKYWVSSLGVLIGLYGIGFGIACHVYLSIGVGVVVFIISLGGLINKKKGGQDVAKG
jgi:hypothetical protein